MQTSIFTEADSLQIGNPISSAVISVDGIYRYQLSRIWDEKLPQVMFIMLNPSTADAEKDDPTIRRCKSFAKSWGFGGIRVGNLFAYRSTDPKEILQCSNPIGEENKRHIDKMAAKCELVICAWGNSDIVNKLTKNNPEYFPLKNITNLRYLELSIDGTPKHPLYLKGNLQPKEYNIQ